MILFSACAMGLLLQKPESHPVGMSRACQVKHKHSARRPPPQLFNVAAGMDRCRRSLAWWPISFETRGHRWNDRCPSFVVNCARAIRIAQLKTLSGRFQCSRVTNSSATYRMTRGQVIVDLMLLQTQHSERVTESRQRRLSDDISRKLTNATEWYCLANWRKHGIHFVSSRA